jgi:hypothetical protein
MRYCASLGFAPKGKRTWHRDGADAPVPGFAWGVSRSLLVPLGGAAVPAKGQWLWCFSNTCEGAGRAENSPLASMNGFRPHLAVRHWFHGEVLQLPSPPLILREFFV